MKLFSSLRARSIERVHNTLSSRIIYIYLFIAGVSLVSCEKELDFKYHDIEPLTVIEAVMTDKGINVEITLTTPMDEPMNTARLTDATVTLSDLTEGTTTTLSPDQNGYYSDSIPGIAGHVYHLSVERQGDRYEASATMYPPTEIVSMEFSWIRMPYDHVAVLQGEFLDDTSTENQYYWIKLYRNGVIYKWMEKDDRGSNDGKCSFFTMTTRQDTDMEDDDTVLFDGDVMTCTICPISKEMHDYLEALGNDSSGPAMFTGDKCLGYFLATTPVSASVVFHPDEIPDNKQ